MRDSEKRAVCPLFRLPRSLDKQRASDFDRLLSFRTASAVVEVFQNTPGSRAHGRPATNCKDGTPTKAFRCD